MASIEALADALYKAGWPPASKEIREGVEPARVLKRLTEEGHYPTSATDLLSAHIEAVRPLKAVVIAEEAPTREVNLPRGDGGDTLDSLQALVGGRIEALPVPSVEGWVYDDATAYINDESKFLCLANARATKFMAPILSQGDTIHGPLVVCGFDASTGENRDIPADLKAQLLRDYQ